MANSNNNITYYSVGLVCNAAPDIGCGSRAKPVLKELDKEENIEKSFLNRKGTLLKLIWKNDVETEQAFALVNSIFKANDISVSVTSPEDLINPETREWLDQEGLYLLSREEAGIIASQLIDNFKSKSDLSKEQETRLRKDIEELFYDFFLNFETSDQLSDSASYKKIRLKIVDRSSNYIDKENIPSVDELLKSCTGHSPNGSCEKSSSNSSTGEGSCCKS